MSNPSPLSRVRDCVVIGGGIAGCTVAYELARRGKRVTLLEQHALAHAASGRNMGLLLNQVEPEVVRIMQLALGVYREVEPAFPFGLRRVDQLLLARDEAQLARTEAVTAAMMGIGVEVEKLDRDVLFAELPFLSADVAGGALVRGAWAVQPAAATRAFAEAAREAGAEIRTGVRVASVTKSGVVSDDGPLTADAVVIASGPWLPELAPAVPITAARGWVMRTGPLPHSVQWIIEEMSWPDQDLLGRAAKAVTLAELAAGDHDAPGAEAFALAPQPDGSALLGTSLARSLLEAVEGVDMPRRLARRALAIAPGLAGVPVNAAWPGTRPMSPDGMPLAGELGGGVWIHGGHGSIGMMAAPATARWLVDAMLGVGAASELDRLSPARFEPGARAG